MALKKITFDEALKDSQKFGKRHLIIGNGFSIAARPNIFTYGSLFKESGIPDDPTLSSVFAALGTTDFEFAIRSLEQSAELVPIYVRDYEDVQAQMKSDAAKIKDILIETVAKNHPDGPFDMKAAEFESCQVFLANFLSGSSAGLIFTVNYDLLLYWTLMHTSEGAERKYLRVDDGFGNDEDDPYADYVVWQGETRAHTPSIYYLHGALHLFDYRGKLQKFTWVRTGERRLCCTNPVWDSSRESSVIAGGHEQTEHTDLPHPELARV